MEGAVAIAGLVVVLLAAGVTCIVLAVKLGRTRKERDFAEAQRDQLAKQLEGRSEPIAVSPDEQRDRLLQAAADDNPAVPEAK